MLEEYCSFCYEYVGSKALSLVPYLEHMNPVFAKAGIEISLPEYISAIIFTSSLGGFLSFFVGSILFYLSNGLSGIFLSFLMTIIVILVTFTAFYFYPYLRSASRGSKIDDILPFATMYLATMAGTGTPLPKIFKNLSEADEYGEVANEAEKIYRDINTFGMNSTKALRESANRTPSEDYKDLVRGMSHTLNTGGSLRKFLELRAEDLMGNYRRRVEEFSETLSLLVEMYITLIVVGSIIFISMSAIMSTLAQDISTSQIIFIQLITIFLGLPMISIMFIILVDGLEPGGIR